MTRIGTKLTAIIMLIMVLLTGSSVILLSSYSRILVGHILSEYAQGDMDSFQQQLDELEQRTVQAATSIAKSNSVTLAFSNKRADTIKSMLQTISTALYADIHFFKVMDTAGTVVADVEDSGIGASLAQAPAVQAALAGQAGSGLGVDADGKAIIYGIVPSTTSSGEVLGYAMAGYYLDKPELLAQLKGNAKSEFALYWGDALLNTTQTEGAEQQLPAQAKATINQQQPYMESNARLFQQAKFNAVYQPLSDGQGQLVGALFTGVPLSSINTMRDEGTVVVVGVALGLALVSMVIVAMLINRTVSRPVAKVAKAAQELASGELSVTVNHRSKDEFGQMSHALNETFGTLRRYISDIDMHLSRVAQGDLTAEAQQEYSGDFAPIRASIVQINQALNETMQTIYAGAQQVNAGAQQVSGGAQSMAQGTAEQAGAVEELSAALEQVSDKVDINLEQVRTAGEIAKLASEELATSNARMDEMLLAMEEITEFARQINHIIKTIDDIAFQTNILALNAAVEAARAGSAGKGFAVVADEVRNLASKSAAAAKQTGELLEGTASKVDSGMRIARLTDQALSSVTQRMDGIIQAFDKVSIASEDQAAAVHQVYEGVQQISTVVQANSAIAEQSAAASEQMAGQSDLLRRALERFQLKAGDQYNAADQPEFGGLALADEQQALLAQGEQPEVDARDLGKY